MKISSKIIVVIGAAMAISAMAPVFAESAPVYDADSVQQQFDNPDNNQDQAQQDVPPPGQAPGQEGAFVPNQAQAAPRESAPVSMSMDQRVRRVEQQLNNMQNTDVSARIDSLQTQVQSLQGQVEQLTHQLQQLQTQQKTQYSDLDKRLSQQNANLSKQRPMAPANPPVADNTQEDDAAIPITSSLPKAKKSAKSVKAADDTTDSTAVAATPADTIASSDNQPNVAEEQQIYQTAYNLIKQKKYSDAVTALQTMLKKYPSGQFASNAHYWLGELYGLMSKNDQALTEFSEVVKTYPESPRVSDAQLKVGLIYASQNKWPEAKAAFKKVINHYPGTASARLASEQLKQIKQAGH